MPHKIVGRGARHEGTAPEGPRNEVAVWHFTDENCAVERLTDEIGKSIPGEKLDG
jgi:hypothetical protein